MANLINLSGFALGIEAFVEAPRRWREPFDYAQDKLLPKARPEHATTFKLSKLKSRGTP